MIRAVRQAKATQRYLAILLIATAATLLAGVVARTPLLEKSIDRIDWGLYDSFYRQRKPESRTDGPVVIIAVDQSSIDRMSAEANQYRWPWPREYWGALLKHLQESGAAAVGIDLFFEEPSAYNDDTGDDAIFAAALDSLTMPVIHAARASGDGFASGFAPPAQRKPLFGAVNIAADAVIREYPLTRNGLPSLALQSVRAAGRGDAPPTVDDPLLLHFYGPHRRADGSTTFRYVPAYEAILHAMPEASPRMREESRRLFAGRIVLIGATADATFDLKSSPIDRLFPGVEAHATAIQNLIDARQVRRVGDISALAIAWIAALLACAGAIRPRHVWVKVVLSLGAIALLFLSAQALFVSRERIDWLPLTTPLFAAGLATVGGLAWTYLIEDRSRRLLLKFLSQYVSPEVAAELSRRGEISLGGVRREMTVMFTDIAGFTDLSEEMPVEQLEKLMNFYLSEMSAVIFELNGTLDKYIGDAIMAFWNAPLDQPDHAKLACRAALEMKRREREQIGTFAALGAAGIHTRIGINTGSMVAGNLGSDQKVNYTAIGDAVNLSSRLEGANKLYGSQILVAEPTYQAARDAFLFRKLDLLRVKGRRATMAVYELLAHGAGATDEQDRCREYETALAAYFRQDWNLAESILVALTNRFPDDVPAQTLLGRVRAFREAPPPAEWDGVHEAKAK